MNLWTVIPAVVAVVATGILPVFLDRSRRLIGIEPSPSLLTYVMVLTPRWIATGILFMQCVCRGDWGAGHSDVLRYAAALVLHGLVGLISFFAIAAAPADLKAVPSYISRCLVTLGFVIPLGFVVFASWFLRVAPGHESDVFELGPLSGAVFLISAGFGGSVFLWALAVDLREQSRLSDQGTATPSTPSAQTRKSPTVS